ncbi:MAG: HD domain-containing protein [Clostridia bacterium]
MGKIYINELQADQIIEEVFLVKEKQLIPFKNKNANYIHLVLGDKTGSIDCKIWEKADQYMPVLQENKYVLVKASTNLYNNKMQLIIQHVEGTKNYDQADFLPMSKRSREEMKQEFFGYVQEINNVKLHTLVTTIFEDKEISTNFFLAPAAKVQHQAYISGLLEHTLGVTKLCRAFAMLYPEIDKDLLLTGALLHDLGKIFELNYEDNIEYSDEGRLLGHIYIGTKIIEDNIKLQADFQEELKMKLLHMILSHHGFYEYQSPKRPKFKEAFLLHYADDIDATMDKLMKAEEENKENNTWSPYNKSLERYLYLK